MCSVTRWGNCSFITIASPHQGTPVSRFGLGWPTVELAERSTFCQGLPPLPDGIAATCIWSRADGLVASRRHAELPGAEEVVFDDLGHMSLLCSRRVAEVVAERLRRGA